MNFSRLVLCAALALGCSTSFAGGGSLDLSSGSAGFSDTPLAGVFSDIWTFTLGNVSVADSTVTTVVNGGQNIDFTSIVLTGPTGPISFNKLMGDPAELWMMPTTTLGSGSYELTLTGVNSPGGASYGGNFAVSPVPEPASYSLLLAGLGAVGFVLIRRRG